MEWADIFRITGKEDFAPAETEQETQKVEVREFVPSVSPPRSEPTHADFERREALLDMCERVWLALVDNDLGVKELCNEADIRDWVDTLEHAEKFYPRCYGSCKIINSELTLYRNKLRALVQKKGE